MAQDVKPSSRYTYERNIMAFFTWIDRTGRKGQGFTRETILQYKDDLLAGGHSSLTVGGYLTAVRRFFEWAESEKLYPNVAKGIKTPRRKQQFKKQPLSNQDSRALLAYYKERSLRDYAIINLLLRTGLRTVELVNADVRDIVMKRHEDGQRRVLLIKGKGRDEKDQFVILTDKAFLSISAYLKERGKAKGGEPLFTAVSNQNNGDRLTTKSIRRIVKEGLRAIGIDSLEFSAHSLRHTSAVSVLKSGASLYDAQRMLRHSSPATTQIYTRTIEEEQHLKNAPEAILDDMY